MARNPDKYPDGRMSNKQAQCAKEYGANGFDIAAAMKVAGYTKMVQSEQFVLNSIKATKRGRELIQAGLTRMGVTQEGVLARIAEVAFSTNTSQADKVKCLLVLAKMVGITEEPQAKAAPKAKLVAPAVKSNSGDSSDAMNEVMSGLGDSIGRPMSMPEGMGKHDDEDS